MDFDERLEKGREIVSSILQGKKYNFSELLSSNLPDKTSGVYVIFDKKADVALYVGRTTNLRQRLYNNHLMGSFTNARLKKYLVEDEEDFSEIKTIEDAKQYLREQCYFKYLILQDYRIRGQIEGFLSFIFDVKYIDQEH